MASSSTSGAPLQYYWNGAQDDASDKLLSFHDPYTNGILPPELVKGKTFQFEINDRKNRLYGWSVQGEVVRYFPSHHPISLDDVITFYGIGDARVYTRLVKPTVYKRFALDRGNNQLCVVEYDRRIMRLKCLSP